MKKRTVRLPDHPVPRGFEDWNPSHRGAYCKGYRAALADEPRSSCPYEDHRKPSGMLSWSRAYIRAWQDGWDDQVRKRQQDIITQYHTDKAQRGQPQGVTK